MPEKYYLEDEDLEVVLQEVEKEWVFEKVMRGLNHLESEAIRNYEVGQVSAAEYYLEKIEEFDFEFESQIWQQLKE